LVSIGLVLSEEKILGIADKYFFFLLGLRPLHISRVGVGGLSPVSISGVYSGTCEQGGQT
jgi:hypothetical protein